MSKNILTKENLRKLALNAVGSAVIIFGPALFKKYLEQKELKEKERIEQKTTQKGKNNEERLKLAEDKIVATIAFMENYFDEPFVSGGAVTIGYGSCYKDNGERVSACDGKINKETAKKYTLAALRRDVFPTIEKYVKRDLSESQLIAVSSFIYAIGSSNFAGIGYDKEGNKKQPCEFLKAINAGKSNFECARKLSGWSKAGGGIPHPGLLKQHWVKMALFCHRIKPEQLFDLTPASIYNFKISDLYKSSRRDRDGYYTPKLDDATINRVLSSSRGSLKVWHILDEKLKKSLAQASTIDFNEVRRQMSRER